MAQHHLDPLSPADLDLLAREDATTPMHLGAVLDLEGPAPPIAEVLEHVRGRLPLVPRYRQRVVAGPLGTARWIDDPTFRLEYHVRHTAQPAHADAARRRRQLGRLFSQRLDRTKPLWELWVVEGPGDRWSVVAKTHRVLVGDAGAVDLLTVLFDAPGERARPAEPWVPHPRPSPAQLAALAVAGGVREATGLPLRAAAVLADPGRAVREARRASEALGDLLRPAPPSPLNVPVGPHRAVAFATLPLDRLKRVKDVHGGTVNDVLLAVTAGAVRHWLHERGTPTGGIEWRAGVPLATRDGDTTALGGALAQVVAPLPVGEPDPLARLRRVSAATRDLKARRAAQDARRIAAADAFAPPTILARAARLRDSTRRYNLLVVNVPGPQGPLHLLGRRLRAAWPVAPLEGDRALAVAALSYAGDVGVGLVADLDVVPDVDVVATGMTAALDELVARSRRRPARDRR